MSEKIRITKQFNFEMAHALYNHDGLCSNIHGHSYKLHVTVIGSPISDVKNPKNGMVLDFKVLKNIVKENITNKFDHAFVINANSDYSEELQNSQLFKKVISLPYQPTCENMLIDFADIIKKSLPDNVKLHSLKLQETNNSYAEWYADDNQ